MIGITNGFHPIIIMIAIGLTIAASYTALDMFTFVKTSDTNKMILFLGGTIALGTGIWFMNFIGLIAADINRFRQYQIPMTILSIFIGIAFTGMAFFTLLNKTIKFYHLLVSSCLLSLAVMSVHMISTYSMNLSFHYNKALLLLSALLISGSFLVSLWILFSSKRFAKGNRIWLKPVSAIIVTGAIVEGYFILNRSAQIGLASNIGNEQGMVNSSIIYLVLFVSILILVGLIGSSAIISKKLEVSDTNLRDIKFALDQSAIVAFTDARGVITNANDKFCEISKYSREELIGKTHGILNSGTHSKEYFKDLWQTIISGKVWKGEICNKAKDGTLYWVDTTIVPFIGKDGKSYQYLSIRNDITERKRTEEILHRQDKLAAVGQLAAGVAHEIRNPLTSMKGYTEFLQLDERDPDRIEFLNIILDEIERVNMIVEDFMVLAKPKAVELEEKNVVPVIKNVLSLLEFEARKKHVRLHLNCEAEIIQIECDENRLKQVFLNFIKNGIEAMPNGGDLSVRTFIKDQNVQISIHDTGVGIPKDKLKKLGEPFFTTKKNGNGLGLMVSFKIIESHHGKVFIESEPNKGTTFNIFLPTKTA